MVYRGKLLTFFILAYVPHFFIHVFIIPFPRFCKGNTKIENQIILISSIVVWLYRQYGELSLIPSKNTEITIV